MAAAPGALVLSRVTDVSPNPRQPPQPPPLILPFSRHLFARPLLPSFQRRRFTNSSAIVSCLISGFDGGGVSDDFVSTRKSNLDRGFSVIANMLKRIEPLDTSVISKGVSNTARDSMKQTISSMLGLLPSDQFSVTVRVSRVPLGHLLVSSIITGYTLWNAEYRISLMRNFDISLENSEKLSTSKQLGVSGEQVRERVSEIGAWRSNEELEMRSPQIFGDLSPEALNFIYRLQSEISNAEEELHTKKQENMRIECDREYGNNLLDYLRSLDSNMVAELSKPSSIEVEEIIHQLVRNILQNFYKDDTSANFMTPADTDIKESSDSDEFCDRIGTSRDYLAKLLFWCMLLGHHLRGLENRLHLSCVVGLL